MIVQDEVVHKQTVRKNVTKKFRKKDDVAGRNRKRKDVERKDVEEQGWARDEWTRKE